MNEPSQWKPYRRAGRDLFYPVVGVLLRTLFRWYTRFEVIGLENVPRTGAAVLASNHASYVDPLLIVGALYGTRKTWLMAKSDLWNTRLLGWVCDRMMAFPVHRNSADRNAMSHALDLLKEGHMVGMFPEGTRTRTGLLAPALPGITLLARKSHAPIIPVALMGTYEMLPPGRKWIHRVPLKIAFGEPLLFAANATREEILGAVMSAIARMMTENGYPTPAPPVPSRQ